MTRAPAATRVGMIAALIAALIFAAVAGAQAQLCDGFDCGEISAAAGYAASSAKSPTLTNDIGRTSDGADWQLPMGIGLLAVGLLGLAYGLAMVLSTRRRAIARAGGAPTRGVSEGTQPRTGPAGSGG